MKNKDFSNFWIGFVISMAAVAWLVWLWGQKREVTPPPIYVKRKSEATIPSSPPAGTIPSEEVAEDSLVVIKGIGPVFAKRLNQAGIFTYSQLAGRTPEELKQITGVTSWDPADWILEAQALDAGS